MHTEVILVFMNEQLHHDRDLHLCYECFLIHIITMCIISWQLSCLWCHTCIL